MCIGPECLILKWFNESYSNFDTRYTQNLVWVLTSFVKFFILHVLIKGVLIANKTTYN